MPVSSKHPDWTDRSPQWTQMRHFAMGEEAVKAQGVQYLPMPSGFAAQDDGGTAMYGAYIARAEVPEILLPTIAGMVGIIHRTEFNIEMPAAMEGLWERATRDGLPLEAFSRRITFELLLTGRYGLLVDAPTTGADLPYFAGYPAETVINWSRDRDFFVLDESGWVRDGFDWRHQKRYRVLTLEDGRYVVRLFEGEAGELADGQMVQPRARGDRPLTEIPFVTIGSRDLSVDPDPPPLKGVMRSSLAIYQLDADYRHQLYMTGQETLVVINGDAPSAVGAGVVVTLKGDGEQVPDMKYVGPSGKGIEAHKAAIEDKRDAAVAAGARIFDNQRKAAESGDALRIRYAAQTATLTSIAQASAAGLEKGLRHAAVVMGQDPTKIVVTPNLDHLQGPMTPTDAEALVRVWQSKGISYHTMYEKLQRGEIASVERTAEEELELIAQEDLDTGSSDEDGTDIGGDPANSGSAANQE